jgi:hypothetical protein
MIGTRGLIAGLAATVALVPLLGSGGPDPAAGLAARALVLDRAELADVALAELADALAPALEQARGGTARIVTGDEPPGPSLAEAGTAIGELDGLAGRVRRALAALNGARAAAGMGSREIPAPAQPGELGSIGAQVGGTAGAADAFAEMRARTDVVTVALEQALVALDEDDLETADGLVVDARAAHDALAAWDVDLVTLPVWLETTDAMIGTMESIVLATRAGDEAAAAAAARTFASLAPDAATADRALRIAIGEGGGAITAAALGRLVDVLRAIDDARAEVASILHPGAAS